MTNDDSEKSIVLSSARYSPEPNWSVIKEEQDQYWEWLVTTKKTEGETSYMPGVVLNRFDFEQIIGEVTRPQDWQKLGSMARDAMNDETAIFDVQTRPFDVKQLVFIPRRHPQFKKGGEFLLSTGQINMEMPRWESPMGFVTTYVHESFEELVNRALYGNLEHNEALGFSWLKEAVIENLTKRTIFDSGLSPEYFPLIPEKYERAYATEQLLYLLLIENISWWIENHSDLSPLNYEGSQIPEVSSEFVLSQKVTRYIESCFFDASNLQGLQKIINTIYGEKMWENFLKLGVTQFIESRLTGELSFEFDDFLQRKPRKISGIEEFLCIAPVEELQARLQKRLSMGPKINSDAIASTKKDMENFMGYPPIIDEFFNKDELLKVWLTHKPGFVLHE